MSGRASRWAARWGAVLIVLALAVGVQAFLGAQRTVASTGSGHAPPAAAGSGRATAGGPSTGAGGAASTGSGSASSGGAAAGQGGGQGGQAATGSANDPTAAGHGRGGSLAMSGADVALLVAAAIALLAAGLWLRRLSRRRA